MNRLEKFLDSIKNEIKPDGSINGGMSYIQWDLGDEDVLLDGSFHIDDLEDLILYIKNKNAQKSQSSSE